MSQEFLDFSSNSNDGGVFTLDSFLEDTPTGDNETPDKSQEKPDTQTTEEVVIDDLGKGDNLDEIKDDIDDPLNPTEPKKTTEEKSTEKSTETPDIDDLVGNKVDYKTVFKTLVSKGLLDDIEAIEDEEGNEIPIDEVDFNEDLLTEIIQNKLEQVQEQASTNKVSVEGISDFTKKLIEIEKNGGDVRTALESYNKYKQPLDDLDLTKEEDQVRVMAMKYQAKGLDEKEIKSLIRGLKNDGLLEEEALQAEAEIKTAFEKQMEYLKQQAEERKKQAQEALKMYKKDLSKKIGEKFKVSDTYKRKLVEVATKQTDEGYPLDNLYKGWRNDPEKAAELSLFLFDRDEYIKQMTKDIEKEVKMKTFKKFKYIPKGKSNIDIKGKDKPIKGVSLEDLS